MRDSLPRIFPSAASLPMSALARIELSGPVSKLDIGVRENPAAEKVRLPRKRSPRNLLPNQQKISR